MGNEHSSHQSSKGDGVPFVSWKNGGYHFAEPSCYKYDKVPKVTTSNIVYTDPKKADGELRNRHELVGNIAVVERGGRVHFPDIIRRLLTAGAIGCIFIERSTTPATQSLFDGFHSSGRQSVSIPIVLLSKYHGDQLLEQKPSRVTIEFISGDKAIQNVVPDDIYFAIATAARAGEVELLKHLLYMDTSGAMIQNIPKAVALCDASEHGHVDCIEMLHGFGISLDEQKPNGTSPLMVACAAGNVEAVRALTMYGASLDLEDVHGLTALMIAARDGKAQCLKLLIRKGARINLSRNRNRGTTALHIASRGGQEECVSILIEAGAALDTPSPNSTTALMEAARAGMFGCVRLLVDAGANLDSKDREGHTAEALARIAGHREIEDFLRERAESDSVKDHRRRIEEMITKPNSTLRQLLSIAKEGNISVDILKREIITNQKSSQWLEQPRIIYEVFRLLTEAPQTEEKADPVYGYYTNQHFSSEISIWYTRKIFQKHRSSGTSGTSVSHPASVMIGPPSTREEWDLVNSSGYLKVLFNFICRSGSLDEVLLILFSKTLNHYILNQQMGELLWMFFAEDGNFIVPWLVAHIGSDSIRDLLVWLLYSDMSDKGQDNIRRSGIFECLFSRLYSWQRTLGWGVGTSYQRDSVENICSLINYIIYPPAVYVMENVATFVDNTDHSLPLITDQYFPNRHNELLKTLLQVFHSSDVSFGTLLDLGYSEIERQTTKECPYIIHEGGALSIVMMIMSTLGYHKRKRDITGIEGLLIDTQKVLVHFLLSRVAKFVRLCRDIVSIDRVDGTAGVTGAVAAAISGRRRSKSQCVSMVARGKGSALLYIITFLKRCVFLQSGVLDSLLAESGLMPCFLACFGAHPNNSLLHHELTDVIRFVLLDPDQQRLPTCPLLNSMFMEGTNILDFVIQSYDNKVQYKGHMTTIANSIFTLTNTPVCKSGGSVAITCQEVVRQYTSSHEDWQKFESRLQEQNLVEMQPLGQRHAPLCDGCLKLKENAVEYVITTLDTDGKNPMTGYLETIFSGAASHYCKVNFTDDFITGYLYKKDKIHDHIPIPEPTRVSSFIQFPVPMPFHALTFTVTFFGLCRKCDKLWYCDTLQSANWANRMKWVIPTSVRKWYSFGVTEGPGSGAHGIQFTTKGYKNFIVLTDTWGRQEQWMHAIDEAILGVATHAARRIDAASAMAIEIDNEVDTDQIDIKKASAASNATWQEKKEEKGGTRKRSNTIGSPTTDVRKDKGEEVDYSDDQTDSARSITKSSSSEQYNSLGTSSGGCQKHETRSDNYDNKHMRRVASERANTGVSDLSKYQPDSKRFAEILKNLKIASPHRVNVQNAARATSAVRKNRTGGKGFDPILAAQGGGGRRKSSLAGSLAFLSGPNSAPLPGPIPSTTSASAATMAQADLVADQRELDKLDVNLRHVASTPDLTKKATIIRDR